MPITQIFNTEQLHKAHAKNDDTKIITLRRCWSIVFDVNGNAPADSTEASFATEELAKQALSLFAAQKDDDKIVAIVVDGTQHSRLPVSCVENYNFDTYYRVKEDWQPDNEILTSLKGLIVLTDEQSDTDSEDGVILADEDDLYGD